MKQEVHRDSKQNKRPLEAYNLVPSFVLIKLKDS